MLMTIALSCSSISSACLRLTNVSKASSLADEKGLLFFLSWSDLAESITSNRLPKSLAKDAISLPAAKPAFTPANIVSGSIHATTKSISSP